MTTVTNALRFLPASTAAWAPDAATEQSVMFGSVLVALVGAGAVVVHALSQVVAFQ
jgi:hypothetical protein